jgi:hypothetical protein
MATPGITLNSSPVATAAAEPAKEQSWADKNAGTLDSIGKAMGGSKSVQPMATPNLLAQPGAGASDGDQLQARAQASALMQQLLQRGKLNKGLAL